MFKLITIPIFLSASLCAQTLAAPASTPTVPEQGPVVQILLQVDPPKAGEPPLDAAPIAKALDAFSKRHGLVARQADQDGWVLGIRLMPQPAEKGIFVAEGALGLTQKKNGVLLTDEAKTTYALVAANSAENLNTDFAKEVAHRASIVMSEASLIPSEEEYWNTLIAKRKDHPIDAKPVKEFSFSLAKEKLEPPPPPPIYPPQARIDHVEGTVTISVHVDDKGLPMSATLVSGPRELVPPALLFAMHMAFEPALVNGEPQFSFYTLNMPFKLH